MKTTYRRTSFFWLPKAQVRDHPLFHWERGTHLDLPRRILRPPLLGCLLGLFLLVVLAVGQDLQTPGNRVALMLSCYGGPLVFTLWARLRLGWRLQALREGGVLRDLYLSGERPLATYIAFSTGANGGWYWLPLWAAMIWAMFGVISRIPLIAIVVFLAVFAVVWFFVRRRVPTGHVGVSATDAAWILLSRDTTEQFLRFLPILMLSLAYPMMLLSPRGVTNLIMFIMLYGGLFAQRLVSRRVRKMEEDEFEGLFTSYCTGEDPLEYLTSPSSIPVPATESGAPPQGPPPSNHPAPP